MNYQKDRHYSEDIERAIIGAVLLEKPAFGRVYGIIKPEIFYYEDHGTIWETITDLWIDNLPVDILSVVNKLMKKGIETLRGNDTPYYVTTCIRDVVGTANLEYWGLLIREMYIEREMMKITLGGMSDRDTWEYMDELQDKMIKLRQIKTSDDFENIGELITKLETHMASVKDKELTGITTGFAAVDRLTGGLLPGGMYILAARPSIGKSAFMGKMIIKAAQIGFHAAVISLEMEDKNITARIGSLVSEVEYWRIYNNRMIDQQQAEDFRIAMQSLKNLPIRISDTARVDMNDIKAKVAKLKQRGQIDILYVDYLQLIESEEIRNRNREQEVAKISRGMKILAKEYNIPVVVLCQLNRVNEEKKEKPKLHNLRESGSLEQDADGVIFIHRDFKSGMTVNADGSSTENEADLIIAKWRDGETANIKIGFDGSRMKFYELEQSNLIPLRQAVSNFYETQKEDPGY